MAKRMALGSIIEQIVASRGDLTREEIVKMIEEKVKSSKGYFTHEIAAHIVASELGVQTSQRSLQPEILIKSLVSGLSDVTATGRVIYASPCRSFTRSDGTEGNVKRLLIADRSGVVKVVLWDEKAKLADIEIADPGQIVKFSHGYVRAGLDGKLELNLGARGEIEVLPQDRMRDEYPPVEKFIRKIGEITGKNRRVNVLGVVQRIFPESLFKRKDGSEGKTRRLWLRDTTGQIRVVFWNREVEEISNLRKGDYLRIMNAKVKSQSDRQLELHVEETSNVEVMTEEIPGLTLPSAGLMKVKDAKQGMRDVSILARVVEVGDMRKFGRSGSETGYFSQLLLEDGTGSIQLNLWGDMATISRQISPGDAVLVERAYARKRFEKISLNLDSKGSIKINPDIEGVEDLPQDVGRRIEIADIKDGEYVTVQGTVVTNPGIREVTTSRKENVKLVSFEISDDTGEVEVTLWRKLAEAAERLSAGDKVEIGSIYAKRDPSGQLRLSSTMLTSFEKMSRKDLGKP